jgi:hypothetical protein
VKRDRTLRHDVVGALAILLGFALGALVLGADASILIGAAIGVTVVLAVRIRRRPKRPQ